MGGAACSKQARPATLKGKEDSAPWGKASTGKGFLRVHPPGGGPTSGPSGPHSGGVPGLLPSRRGLARVGGSARSPGDDKGGNGAAWPKEGLGRPKVRPSYLPRWGREGAGRSGNVGGRAAHRRHRRGSAAAFRGPPLDWRSPFQQRRGRPGAGGWTGGPNSAGESPGREGLSDQDDGGPVGSFPAGGPSFLGMGKNPTRAAPVIENKQGGRRPQAPAIIKPTREPWGRGPCQGGGPFGALPQRPNSAGAKGPAGPVRGNLEPRSGWAMGSWGEEWGVAALENWPSLPPGGAIPPTGRSSEAGAGGPSAGDPGGRKTRIRREDDEERLAGSPRPRPPNSQAVPGGCARGRDHRPRGGPPFWAGGPQRDRTSGPFPW